MRHILHEYVQVGITTILIRIYRREQTNKCSKQDCGSGSDLREIAESGSDHREKNEYGFGLRKKKTESGSDLLEKTESGSDLRENKTVSGSDLRGKTRSGSDPREKNPGLGSYPISTWISPFTIFFRHKSL